MPFPLAAAALVGGSNIAGSALSLWDAQQNRNFQRNMSETAYQRSVADMRAAGLNPSMMFGGSGGAASTPSGSTGSVNLDASSAVQAYNSVQQTEADVAVKEAQASKLKAEETLSVLNGLNVRDERFGREAAGSGKPILHIGGDDTWKYYRRLAELELKGLVADLENTSAATANTRQATTASEEEGPSRRFRNSDWGIGLDAVDKGAGVVNKLVPKLKLDLGRRSASDSFGAGGGNAYGGANSAKRVRKVLKRSQGHFDNKARPLDDGLGTEE